MIACLAGGIKGKLRRVVLASLSVLAVVASGPAAVGAEPVLRCPRFTDAEPPSATARSDRHAVDRFRAINEAVKTTPHSVLFFGDSLTEGWDAAAWKKELAPRGVLNAGINGDRTDHLLWRLEHGNLAGPPPRAVIVLIGTNDLGAGR